MFNMSSTLAQGRLGGCSTFARGRGWGGGERGGTIDTCTWKGWGKRKTLAHRLCSFPTLANVHKFLALNILGMTHMHNWISFSLKKLMYVSFDNKSSHIRNYFGPTVT
jgi:hypothetical protein